MQKKLFDIGNIIHQIRTSKNITQELLAERANLSISFISRIERNTVNNISILKLSAIAQALDVKITDLLSEEEKDLANLSHNPFPYETFLLFKKLSDMDEHEAKRVSHLFLEVINTFEK